ncbi:MAG: hypothetical protein QG566_510 [Patescibacteria group bacterium]|nr:hypothetical protein [Patescibacteria group bacterium]
MAILARPFWRRPWITFLPAEVLDRERNPWVFALFLLLGLYVKDIREIYTKIALNASIPSIHRIYTG